METPLDNNEFKVQLLVSDGKIKPQKGDLAWIEGKQETIISEPEEAKEQYIHLRCRCGQRVKILSQYAGKIGRCPKCSVKWRIPEV